MVTKMLSLVIVTTILSVVNAQYWNKCAIDLQHRRECPVLGDTIRDCLNQGCCWHPCVGCPKSVPWCFIAADMYEQRCLVPFEEKDDCGYYGISRETCLGRGCCYMPSSIHNEPWCFHPIAENIAEPGGSEGSLRLMDGREAPPTPTPTPTTTTTPVPTTTEYGNEGELRLVNGLVTNEGRLEIYHNGRWGTICDDGFGMPSAGVACRQLGLPESGVAFSHNFGGGSGPIHLDEVHCLGTETSISDCPRNSWGHNNCFHYEDVGIRCTPPTPTPTPTTTVPTTMEYGNEGELRLVNGLVTNEGRLEIYHNGRWGTICDDGFSTPSAKVACRQLGLPEYGLAFSHYFGEGSGPIHLDEVRCLGTETRISDCPRNSWGHNNCFHYEDVGIRCTENIAEPGGSEGELRLVNGLVTNEGRLEIYHNGRWGTICDDGFNMHSAKVACCQLGLPEYGVAFSDNFGEGSGPIHLSEVQCLGTETRISDCPRFPWGYNDCFHADDVGIRCTENIAEPGGSEGSLRLMDGREGKNEGRLEIYHDGHWGTVCDEHFNSTVATVVCRQLGLPEQGTPVYISYFGSGEGRPILLDNVICTGSEQNLTNCHHMPWGQHNCGHPVHAAGVSCEMVYQGEVGDLRLIDGPEVNTGRLEVYYGAGMKIGTQFWGTICNIWDFTQMEARVACRQMGYDNGDVYPRPFQGFRRPVLNDVKCVGDEQRLTDCTNGDIRFTYCRWEDTVSITCEN